MKTKWRKIKLKKKPIKNLKIIIKWIKAEFDKKNKWKTPLYFNKKNKEKRKGKRKNLPEPNHCTTPLRRSQWDVSNTIMER